MLMIIQKMGDVDKSEAILLLNPLIFSSLHYFLTMGKKFVFSVAVKSRKKTVFFATNNVTNATFAVVNLRSKSALI